MRTALLGTLVGVGLALAFSQARSDGESVYGYSANQSNLNPELLTHFSSGGNGSPHTVAVIDPRARVLSVYHIEEQTGVIALKSVRNMSWDLQMIVHDNAGLKPQDIRSGLQK